jgi:hypothetical protein
MFIRDNLIQESKNYDLEVVKTLNLSNKGFILQHFNFWYKYWFWVFKGLKSVEDLNLCSNLISLSLSKNVVINLVENYSFILL